MMMKNGMPGEIDETESKQISADMERLSLAYRASMSARGGMSDVNDVKMLKQKNKVLKEAVLKERELKADVQKKLDALQAIQLESMKVLDKKEEQIIFQEQTIQQLRDSLLVERNNSSKYMDLYQKVKTQMLVSQDKDVTDASPSESFFSGFTSIIGLSSSNTTSAASTKQASAGMAKLQAANTALSEEVAKSHMATVNAEEKIRTVQIAFQKEIESLKQSTSQQISALEEALKAKSQLSSELESKLAEEKEKVKVLSSQVDDMNAAFEESKQKIESVQDSFAITLKQKDALQQECDEAKTNLANAKKENEGLTATIICRKDLEGQHIMDFDTLKERFSMNVNDVRDVICEYEPEPVLTLNLNKSNTLVFKGSTTEIRAAEKKFRQFVMDAPSSKQSSRSINVNQKEQKGLVDNLYSFFK